MTTPGSGELDHASVGAALRAAREAKRLSIQDLNRSTRIQVSYLEAIDEDRFTDLPPAPYVEIFLASYAKAVALPPREILDRYYGLTGESPTSQLKVWDEAAEEAVAPRARRFPWLLIVLVVALLVAVVLLARRG